MGLIIDEVAPGQEIAISVELKAPEKPGRYVGHFRMQSGAHRFGHRVWADVVVVQKFVQEMKMSITPDVALAVSAKLRELQTPEPAVAPAATPSPAYASGNMSP